MSTTESIPTSASMELIYHKLIARNEAIKNLPGSDKKINDILDQLVDKIKNNCQKLINIIPVEQEDTPVRKLKIDVLQLRLIKDLELYDAIVNIIKGK